MQLQVKSLLLREFRNYSRLKLSLNAQNVVLLGNNGAGKTNLLEALSLLSPGRGLRRAKLGEMSREASPIKSWLIEAEIEKGEENLLIQTQSNGEKREVKVDDRHLKGQAGLSQILSLVWLTPSMDRLFMEGASARRRFLDRFTHGIIASHAKNLASYERLYKERLKLWREGATDKNWLLAIEQQMVENGLIVTQNRLQALQLWEKEMQVANGFFPQARLLLQGEIEDWVQNEAAPQKLFQERLLKERNGGGKPCGPQTSDLRIWFGPKDMPAELGSTGEQKSLLLGLILAQARILSEQHGHPPLILLDEAVAHLDNDHRDQLFANLGDLNSQSWLSGTDLASFQNLKGQASFFEVRDNQLFAVA